MQGEFIYVGHSSGVYEGTKYDNVKISNGISVISVRNRTGANAEIFAGLEPERTHVLCTFALSAVKEVARLDLIKIEPIAKK
jgi:hypothetical protein